MFNLIKYTNLSIIIHVAIDINVIKLIMST